MGRPPPSHPPPPPGTAAAPLSQSHAHREGGGIVSGKQNARDLDLMPSSGWWRGGLQGLPSFLSGRYDEETENEQLAALSVVGTSIHRDQSDLADLLGPDGPPFAADTPSLTPSSTRASSHACTGTSSGLPYTAGHLTSSAMPSPDPRTRPAG
ncbi:hypothetical protein V8E36_002129 [Tilletia maclaganii]